MTGRLARVLLGIIAVAALAMGFAWGFGQWWRLDTRQSQEVDAIYAGATGLATLLCLAGHSLRIRSQAYYVIIAGAVFLAVDFLVWQRFGIMPSAKFLRGGFPPAAIMGLFAGAVYRVVAVPTPVLPRDPRA